MSMVYCLLGDLERCLWYIVYWEIWSDVFGILFIERSGVKSLVYCLLGYLE